MAVPINYVAVIVCVVAAMVLGYVWYGPLFGKKWMTLMGWSSADAMPKGNMGRNYAIQAIGALLMAFVLTHNLVFGSAYLNMTGVSAGLQAAFWNWLGFVVPVTVGSVLWDGKPWSLWFINAGYYLVTLLVMGVILAMWQ